MTYSYPHPASAQLSLPWRIAGLLGVLFLTTCVLADPPLPYKLAYDAHFGSFSAKSERSRQFDAASQTWHVQALSYVTIFGKDLTRITEDASFGWKDNLPVPQSYSFVQTGIGKRSRSVEFDHQAGVAHFRVNDERGDLPLEMPVYDDLSFFLVIRDQLQRGLVDLNFDAVDRNEIKHYLYRVVDRPQLKSAIGTYATVHVERIRDEGSQRTTEFWLVPELDYLLVKMLQVEPNGREIRLDIRSAQLDGKNL